MKTAAMALLALSLTVPALAEADRISAPALRELQQTEARLKIFDARTQASFEKGHIPGAVLPLPDDYYRTFELYRQKLIPAPPDADAAVADAVKDLPRDTPIVTYCSRDCASSGLMASRLRELGFTQVQWLVDGIQAWQEAGYPVEKVQSSGL